MIYFSKIHPSGTPYKSKWEKVPQEDLFEDGELNQNQVKEKISKRVLNVGDWVLIREVE
tara:strand:+ start:660 stop:836 length:177 start_codon:yes stop_codon:yes gene_type:complete